MTTVLKLGGSVLTQKDDPETIDRQALRAAAESISGTADLVIVHGGGSFGHHHAADHGVSTTDGTDDTAAIRAIHGAMKRLNGAVVEALADEAVPALPVHPLSVAARDAAGGLSVPVDAVSRMLTEGFVPVAHGDVVVHEGSGATILSGDELVVEFAESIDADRVGVCSAVPGVFDTDGEVIDRIESTEEVAAALGESDATDVTGGMAGKVTELLALSAPAYVFDLGGLAAFLDGDQPGTQIG